MRTTMSRAFLPAAIVLAGAMILGAAGLSNGASHSLVATPTSVAIVDIQAMFKEGALAELTALNDTLKASGQQRQIELNKMSDEMTKLKKDIEIAGKDSPERTELQARWFVKQSTYDATAKAYQLLIDYEKADVLRTIYNRILDSSKALAERDGIDLVLVDDRSLEIPNGSVPPKAISESMQARRVLYANEAIDITQRLITLMNNQFNAPPKSAPAPTKQ